VEIDGRDAGRLNFELFGEEAPKTVNNFLAFCSGDFSRYMKFRDSKLHQTVPGKFVRGGDFERGDGTGAGSVYDARTFAHEKNQLRFKEPYLLAAAANHKGEVGSQFIITLDSLPSLNGSDHTIFGRLLSGRETLSQIEGVDSFRKDLNFAQTGKDSELEPAKVFVKNAGVYKFEQKASQMRTTSAVGRSDFKPEDFLKSREKK